MSSRAPFALVRADPAVGPAGWWRFDGAEEVLTAARAAEVPGLLRQVERAAASGLWAVGFVSYEAAPGFDPALTVRAVPEAGTSALPAARFVLFPPPHHVRRPPLPGAEALPPRAGSLRPTVTEPDYLAAVAAVRDAIARGDTYQCNLTYRLRGRLGGGGSTPRALFRTLVRSQESPYAVFLETGGPTGGQAPGVNTALCCASPELFFRREGDSIVCRPMKGTAARGRAPGEDRSAAETLRRSPKERAENVMIVDMVRNDLGRIARTGTVEVRDLFRVERYRTLFQMTSTVAAASDAPLAEIFAALFPCASITGAPKVRSMEILAGLETTPRGVYTGAVGFVAPGGTARFAVGIRTALLETAGGDRGWNLEYGTGSGVVWDSDPASELAETRTKALALERALSEMGSETISVTGSGVEAESRAGRPDAAALRLLETMAWRPTDGYALLERHLDRLAASGAVLGFPVDLGGVRSALDAEAERLASWAADGAGAARGESGFRVRLLVDGGGHIEIESAPLRTLPRTPRRIDLAAEPVDGSDLYLRHKTTRRGVYERALEHARRRAGAAGEVDDVLLWNRCGELTESTVANLVLDLDGELVTPATACGLLPGTLRSELLARGTLREARVHPEDLHRARRLWLINSVRGWMPARLVGGHERRPAAGEPVEETGAEPGCQGRAGGEVAPPADAESTAESSTGRGHAR